MSDEPRFTHVADADIPAKERRGGGASSKDVSGALGATEMTVRVWTYGPGHEMAYHRHKNQEEIYRLLSGGPQEINVGGGQITMNDGDWVRVPKDTPRRIQNRTDRTAVWLTMGAPYGEGIMDGIRLDPETGEEIPRP
jgi:quercetin dioxygenase-like cupin family protein